jgi:hypothetical protein
LAFFRAPDGTATYPGVFTFSTDYAAWSPGGGYLMEPLTLLGYTLPALHLPPPAAMRAELHLDHAPLVPVRDAAMQAVYNSLASNANPDVTAAQVAWRPDGAVMAAQFQLAPGGDNVATASHAVTLYRADTGAVLATLQPPASRAPYLRAPSLLRWSSDGARLLLLDRNLDGAVIWQPAALPKS